MLWTKLPPSKTPRICKYWMLHSFRALVSSCNSWCICPHISCFVRNVCHTKVSHYFLVSYFLAFDCCKVTVSIPRYLLDLLRFVTWKCQLNSQKLAKQLFCLGLEEHCACCPGSAHPLLPPAWGSFPLAESMAGPHKLEGNISSSPTTWD